MKRCSSCGLSLEDVTAKFCPQCGATLESVEAPSASPPTASDQDDDDFQVFEAHHDDGGFLNEAPKARSAGDDRSDDKVEITGNDPDALSDPDFSQAPLLDPIGESEPPAPESHSAEEFLTGRTSSSEQPKPPETEQYDPNGLPRLSQEQVSEIEQRMQITQNSYLSDEEKRKLLESMDSSDQPFGNTPIVPPKKALAQAAAGGEDEKAKNSSDAKPFQPIFQGGGSTGAPDIQPAAPSGDTPPPVQQPRGTAYFYKNYVQLEGSPHLHNHDELTLGERSWILRRKQFSPAFILAVVSPIAALILFVIALQFVNTGGRGDGSMIGMVVDEYEQPFVHGALIRLPEIGKAYESNAEGFFVTEQLPAGNYRVEWLVDGTVVGVAYATVVDEKFTTLTIRPSEELVEQLEAQESASKPRAQATPQTKPSQSTTRQASKPPTTSSSSNNTKKQSSSSQKSASSSSSGSSKKPPTTAKLVLAANIDNAKLMLDGEVLGLGNMTYSRLSPGDHSYMVIADGYESVSGRVTLEPGKTKTLKVALPILAQAKKQDVYTADDFYYSGVNAARDSEFETAVQDLTEAIRLEPNHVKAYKARGDAYSRLREKDKAHDDYVRAAEIHRFNKEFNYAITAYNEALQMNDESVTAHMGRAALFMAKNEEVAAIADFESVLRVDRRNFDAYLGLGKARFARSNYKKAIKAFKDARSIREDDPIVHQYLMLAYMADSDFDEVQKSYEKFVQVASPEDVASFKKDRTYSAIMRVVKENN